MPVLDVLYSTYRLRWKTSVPFIIVNYKHPSYLIDIIAIFRLVNIRVHKLIIFKYIYIYIYGTYTNHSKIHHTETHM